MAGTGHPYEIANLSQVLAVIEEAAARAPEGEARRWFRSRHMLRFLTSPRYVARVPGNCEGALDAFDADERDLLRAKAEGGGDIRLFSREMQEAIGPDLGHIADWISWASRHDPRVCTKLPRITVPQAAARAEEWTLRLMSRAALKKGRTEEVMRTSAGRVWVELLDPDALAAEGAAMDHCVGGYAGYLLSGWSRIFSLRDARGRSLVTAEFLTDAPLRLRQARAAGNAPVPAHAQPCLAALMERLGAALTDAAETAGVTVDASGRWVPVAEAWERTEWNGFVAVASGTRMIVMSPRNPALPLARVTFSDTGRTRGVAVPAESRHFHIDELRAAARIRNILCHKESAYAQPGWPGLRETEDGQWSADRDLWERRELGGIACLVRREAHGEAVHVTKSDDEARTLLVIGDARDMNGLVSRPRYGYVTASPRESSRWSLREARRCMAVLTAMGVRTMERDGEDGRRVQYRWRPVVSPDGNWSLFTQDSVAEPALTCRGEWRFNEWLAELTSPTANVTVTRRGDRVLSVSSWFLKREAAEEAAAFMEEKGWRPEGRASGNALRHGRNGDHWLAFFRGRWLAVSSPEEFLDKALCLLPSRRAFRLSRLDAETVFASLPEERTSDAADRLLAAALETWGREAAKEKDDALLLDPRAAGGALFPELHWSDAWEGRLRLAARLESALSPAALKAIGKAAAAVLRQGISGRSRRMSCIDPRWPAVARILAEHSVRLPEKLAARALKKGLGGFNDFPVFPGEKAPHPAWFGPLLRLAEAHGCSHALREAADRTLYRLKPGTLDGLSLEDARRWLACFRLAATCRFHFKATELIGGFADALARIAAETKDDMAEWQALAREAEALRSPLERDFHGTVALAA